MVDDLILILRKFVFGSLLVRNSDIPEDAGEWGNRIAWRTLQAGEVQASLERKPMMLIAFFPGCPVCGSLKKSIAASEEISLISPYFVMSIINELEVPQKKKYYPDEIGYVPRVMFYDHNGRPMTQYFNQLGNPTKKYFYPNARSLYKTMEQVAAEYGFSPLDQQE